MVPDGQPGTGALAPGPGESRAEHWRIGRPAAGTGRVGWQTEVGVRSPGPAERACEGEARDGTLTGVMALTDASPSGAEDAEAVRRMAAGDQAALSLLYDRYGQILYAVAYRVTGQRADAEEAVMEAFAQAWRDASRFEAGRGSVAAWLTMMARSRALDLIRARDRRTRITESAAWETSGDPPAMGTAAEPGRRLEDEERRRQVAAALAALAPAQRQAIELAYYEGLSQSEIAERLQEPLGTVKTRMRVGMQKLREALRPYYFEGAL